MISAMPALVSAADDQRYLSVTGRRYLLTGSDCLEHTVPSDCEVREGRHPGFSVLVPWSEGMYLLVCSGSLSCVHYPTAEKRKPTNLLPHEEVTTPAYVFGRREPQHGIWMAGLS